MPHRLLWVIWLRFAFIVYQFCEYFIFTERPTCNCYGSWSLWWFSLVVVVVVVLLLPAVRNVVLVNWNLWAIAAVIVVVDAISLVSWLIIGLCAARFICSRHYLAIDTKMHEISIVTNNMTLVYALWSSLYCVRLISIWTAVIMCVKQQQQQQQRITAADITQTMNIANHEWETVVLSHGRMEPPEQKKN